MLFSELKCKDVINLRDCRKLGNIADFEFDECTGCICKVIVPGGAKWKSIFGCDEGREICYKDAQGVMACEMATFGIPLITSDIPVCREVFSDFGNVTYISNEKCDISLEGIYDKISNKFRKNEKYFAKNTCGKEVRLLNELYTEINKDI